MLGGALDVRPLVPFLSAVTKAIVTGAVATTNARLDVRPLPLARERTRFLIPARLAKSRPTMSSAAAAVRVLSLVLPRTLSFPALAPTARGVASGSSDAVRQLASKRAMVTRLMLRRRMAILRPLI